MDEKHQHQVCFRSSKSSILKVLIQLPLPLLHSDLLDALTKNGSSAGNGAYRRRAAEPSESADAAPERERQESGGGDSSKGFTKEQVDGVTR